jgi:3-isopropylmalate/(R)-2-methylmalate dehydratase large subunit
MMGKTITEKILARASGLDVVRSGDEIMVRPDFIHCYDFPGYTDVFFRDMKEEFGLDSPPAADRFALFIDHMVPAKTPKEEEFHILTREWGRTQGIPVYEGEGIGHQVASEIGYAAPGSFLVHFDGHISQLGAFGMLALGLRRNILEAFVRESISLRVPDTTKVIIDGSLPAGIMARDVFHYLLQKLGPSFCRFQVLELAGSTIAAMSIEQRQVLCGLAMFTGAITAIVNPDEKSLTWVNEHQPLMPAMPETSDEDATFSAVHKLDISELVPLAAAPPHPANIVPLSQVHGLEITAGYIGSCASGRMDDIRAAAAVLKGKRIKSGFRLNVVPTSRRIMVQASNEGLITELSAAGAFISSPSCDYCFGHIGNISGGQRALSTGTLNVPGRMGSPDAEIYLVSAASVAASALEGRVVDPREYL